MSKLDQVVVEPIHLGNFCQIGSFTQLGVNIKKICETTTVWMVIAAWVCEAFIFPSSLIQTNFHTPQNI